MTELSALCAQAQAADPTSRIFLRDPIAGYGAEAISPMAAWLTDERVGSFAVRVLQRIGADPADRSAVLTALTSVDRTHLTADVRRDIDAALIALRPSQHRPPVGERRGGGAGPRRPRPTRLDGDTTEERFNNAMLEIYWLAGEATGYWASYFLRAVRAKSGLVTARDLLRKTGTSPGFERLRSEDHLDLSMEALVIDPEFSGLFTPDEVALARSRLLVAGYHASDNGRA